MSIKISGASGAISNAVKILSSTNYDGTSRYFELSGAPTALGSEKVYINNNLKSSAGEVVDSPFSAGLTVTAGSATAAASNTASYTAGAVITDFAEASGGLGIIASVVLNTSVTFQNAWAGASFSGACHRVTIKADYAIRGKCVALKTAALAGDTINVDYV